MLGEASFVQGLCQIAFMNVLVWLCCLGVLCLKCPYINITRIRPLYSGSFWCQIMISEFGHLTYKCQKITNFTECHEPYSAYFNDPKQFVDIFTFSSKNFFKYSTHELLLNVMDFNHLNTGHCGRG